MNKLIHRKKLPTSNFWIGLKDKLQVLQNFAIRWENDKHLKVRTLRYDSIQDPTVYIRES